MLWGAGALLIMIPIVALIAVALTGGLTTGNRWAWIGCLILLGTIELFPALKAAEAFLEWKERG
jgi:hypothetical protein